ncbi:cupredoxin domain-containing protein [Halorarius litoreus]|uniref:cupredoxin domain-containing protein n=1 Tax=Halorarius litoreus TaxID=2962676 RepID=UPI0020CBBA0B|nr:plastocyanin/azurin family copper-binding protein [Halorarius litoreus]
MRPNRNAWTRRRVLTATGIATVVGLSGCTSGPGVGQPTATPTPTPSPTATRADDDHHEEGGHHEEEDHHDTPTHEEDPQHEHDGPLPEAPAASASVEMLTTESGQHHFEPHIVWVEEGGTVSWELTSGVHTATAYAEGNRLPQRVPEGTEAWDSGMVSEVGATFEHTFDTPGVYDYVCTPHRSVAMSGTVVVGHPDPHDQPGLSEPGSGLGERERHKLEELNEMVNEMLGHTH